MIDPMLPTILRARGMSRRDAAAALRVMEEKGSYSSEDDAEYVLREALGSMVYGKGDYDADKYDIAIAKGVRLVERRYGVRGTTTGTTVVIDRVLPVSVAGALHGKTLRHVVDHPLLPGDAEIRDIRAGTHETEIDIMVVPEELAVIMPATQTDIALARRAWKRLRRDQVREAEAVNGYCPKIVRKAVKRVVIPSSISIAMALAAIIALDERVTTTIAVAQALIVVAFTTIRALLIMRRAANKEDSGLLPRLNDLRWNRIQERRHRILSGMEET